MNTPNEGTPMSEPPIPWAKQSVTTTQKALRHKKLRRVVGRAEVMAYKNGLMKALRKYLDLRTRFCGNDNCGKMYLTHHRHGLFCSTECANNTKARRYRRRVKYAKHP